MNPTQRALLIDEIEQLLRNTIEPMGYEYDLRCIAEAIVDRIIDRIV